MLALLQRKKNARKVTSFVALMLLCASVMMASHVHGEEHTEHDHHTQTDHEQHDMEQELFEHCSSYHVVDAQQEAADEAMTIGELVDSCYFASHSSSFSPSSIVLPPSRASPKAS